MRSGVGYFVSDFPFWPLTGNETWHLDLVAGRVLKVHQGLIYGVLLNIPPFFNFCRISSSCKVGRKGKPCRFRDVALRAERQSSSGLTLFPGGREPGAEPLSPCESTEWAWWRGSFTHHQTSTKCPLRGPPCAGRRGRSDIQGRPDPWPLWAYILLEDSFKQGHEQIETSIFRAW